MTMQLLVSRMVVTVALAAIGAAAGPVAAAAPVAQYRCGDENVTLITRHRRTYLTIGRAQYSLDRAPSASGVRYTGKDVEFWEKGATAQLTIGKRPTVVCAEILAEGGDRARY